MELYLLRHTTAADPHGYAQDADRPLTDSGRKEAETVGQALRAVSNRIELVLTSPYLRARETAGIVAGVLQLETPEDSGLLLPGADPTALLAHISQRRTESILVVGHAPDLSYIVSALLFGEEVGTVAIGKGGFAIIEADRPLRRRRGTLQAFIPLTASEQLIR